MSVRRQRCLKTLPAGFVVALFARWVGSGCQTPSSRRASSVCLHQRLRSGQTKMLSATFLLCLLRPLGLEKSTHAVQSNPTNTVVSCHDALRHVRHYGEHSADVTPRYKALAVVLVCRGGDDEEAGTTWEARQQIQSQPPTARCCMAAGGCGAADHHHLIHHFIE
jgi:hypothetical protein